MKSNLTESFECSEVNELYGSPKWPNLETMNDVRKKAIWLLLIVLPLSSVADAFGSCVEDSEQPPSQEAVIDAHALHGSSRHDSTVRTQDTQDSTSHYQIVQGDESAPIDCPSCDHCVTTCVMSGCGAVAISAEPSEPSFDADRLSNPLSDYLRAGPAPHPLFRPPSRIA
jgi:hypothetical protein